MDKNNELLKKVLSNIDDIIGDDIKNLSKVHDMYQKVSEDKVTIEKKLSMASSEAPSKVSAAVKAVELVCGEIAKETTSYDELSVHVQTHLSSIGSLSEQLHNQVEKVNSLEQCLSYLLWIQDVEALSNQLEGAFQSKNERRAVSLLAEMSEKRNTLQGSECLHLVSFITETLHFWQTLVKEKLSLEFDEVLKALKWPFVSGSQVLAAPISQDTILRFELLVELLLKLELPETNESLNTSSALLVNFAPPPLPLQLMVSSLRKRFIYHFSGTRQTNRLDKPEWYMAQVLAWIRDHKEFVQQRTQHVIERVLGTENECDASIEFMRALVQLVLEKLHSELANLQQNDALFAHTIDETLAFDKELRSIHSYPLSQPGVISVLTQASVFIRWIAMEKKYARERMDAMLSSDTAWKLISEENTDHDLHITECAENILNLLLTITNRYNTLKEPGHRLQFLDMQLELLDEFRMRINQLLHNERNDPIHSQLPSMLNTISYITAVLKEWSDQPHFLQLQFYREHLEGRRTANDEDVQGSAFDEPFELYQRLITSLLDSLVEAAIMDFKAKSREYRKDKWYAMIKTDDKNLTPSSCGMFQILSTRLLELQEILSNSLFIKVWHNLAEQLGQFIIDEVILVNWFNEAGAKQLQYDMTHGLFPMFGQFTSRPDNHFKEVKEACILLNLAAGSAKLLVEELKNGSLNPKDVLCDVGVQKLDMKQSLIILIRRNDIRADHDYE